MWGSPIHGIRLRFLPVTKILPSIMPQTMEPPGQKPLVIIGVVVGPFEEEEEGTGVTSDVVKVNGEDPATPGPLIES